MPLARCAVLAATLALVACSTTAERPVATLAERLRLAHQEQDACYDGLRGDPALVRVLAYSVVDADDPEKAKKINDRRTVTAPMRRDLVEVRRATNACRALAKDRFGAVDPAYVEVLTLTHDAEDGILLAMLNRRLRVGAANQRLLRVDELSDAAWEATTSVLTERPDDTPAAAALRREVAASAVRRLAEERKALEGLRGVKGGACRLAGAEIDCGSA